MLKLILESIWFILPAYFANMLPAVLSKTKIIQNSPKIDFGFSFKGKPILGSGKTWAGMLLGLSAGIFIGWIQSNFPFIPHMSIKLALFLALGAMLGDLSGSFIKRRFGLKRGARVILLDQLDFLIGAFLFSSLVLPINLTYFGILLIITPLLHLFTNFLGWKMGFKSEPW